ncbi:small multi-drug export protein [Chloroflexota bacterium]
MIAFLRSIDPAIVLVFLTAFSIVVFLATWFLLNRFYSRASGKWPFFDRAIQKTREKGRSRLVKKYGLVGILILLAIPLPTIGAYGGSSLCWLMGIKWWSSLITIVLGTTISNSIVVLSTFGIGKVVGFAG